MKHEHDTARQVVELLNENTQRLDPKVAVRLEEARHAAVARLQAQGAVAAGPAGLTQVFMDYISQHRVIMPTAMMCGAVLLAFVVTQQFIGHDGYEQGDAFLLASDLPPEAYLDKGFDEWLERTSQF
jgi:hypothetical protein